MKSRKAIESKKILMECGCANCCCVLRLEYFDIANDLYLQVHPKWKHKGHGVILNQKSAGQLRDYLNDFLKQCDESERIL